MTISIIIAVKAYCENLSECVNKCLELDTSMLLSINFKSKDYEIIILPDSDISQEDILSHSKIKVIPTGDVTPPKKRDVGASYAKGEILAFLDDDAYPDKNWLKEAITIFKESDDIGCVCGPAVTPDSDSILQKGSGLVYSSSLVSGSHSFRYIPKERREVFDFPSCNFLIKKDFFEKIGGFDKPFWPGEDTFLCLKVSEADQRMIYDPKVLVFHHRRNLFKGHLNQIKSYALHRGYFVKKYPKNSLCIECFIPSIFVLVLLVGGFLSSFFPSIEGLYSFVLIIYLAFILASSLLLIVATKENRMDRVKLLFLTISGIFLTHFIYGIYFIKGLLAKKMPEE